MPRYEYECKKCGRTEAAFRSMEQSSKPLVLLDWECQEEACPHSMERVISLTNGKVVGGTPKHHA